LLGRLPKIFNPKNFPLSNLQSKQERREK
jgi:hypothetical protein